MMSKDIVYSDGRRPGKKVVAVVQSSTLPNTRKYGWLFSKLCTKSEMNVNSYIKVQRI